MQVWERACRHLRLRLPVSYGLTKQLSVQFWQLGNQPTHTRPFDRLTIDLATMP